MNEPQYKRHRRCIRAGIPLKFDDCIDCRNLQSDTCNDCNSGEEFESWERDLTELFK